MYIKITDTQLYNLEIGDLLDLIILDISGNVTKKSKIVDLVANKQISNFLIIKKFKGYNYFQLPLYNKKGNRKYLPTEKENNIIDSFVSANNLKFITNKEFILLTEREELLLREDKNE